MDSRAFEYAMLPWNSPDRTHNKALFSSDKENKDSEGLSAKIGVYPEGPVLSRVPESSGLFPFGGQAGE